MEQQDEMQQMAYFLQVAEEQIKTLDAQQQVMEQGIQDITTTLVTIEGLEKADPDPATGTVNTMLPIGASSFVRTSITKPKKYTISIGARYYVELDFEASKNWLTGQKEKMESTSNEIATRIQQLVEQAEKIRPVLEQRLSAFQQQGQQGPSMPSSKINLDDI